MTETPAAVANFFRAMQTGAAAEHDMAALFADDAVYVEPFSGQPTTHRGKGQIMTAMRAGWSTPLPDMTINLDRVDVEGDEVRVAWTCRSPALPGGIGRGVNQFVLHDGKIVRLETSFV